MSSRARRQSHGGSLLRDSTNSSRRSGRMSLGGAMRVETPQKDKRALLDDWRRNSRNQGDDASDGMNGNGVKRARTQQDAPPLPPSSSTAAATASKGTTALERFRMRKQMKEQQQQQQQQSHSSVSHSYDFDSAHGTPTKSRSGLCLSEDDEISFSTGVGSTPSRRTPSRRLGSGARRRSMLPPRQADPSRRESEHTEQTHQTLSQLTVDSDAEEQSQCTDKAGGSEEAGLKSRLREAEQRIHQLENEKMKLSLALAPLKANLQQKEDEWGKKEDHLYEEIESLNKERREADNRYRDLQASFDNVEGELKRYKLEAKNPFAAASRTGASDSSRLDRLCQNDRLVNDLKEQLRSANDEIQNLRLENVSTQKELHGTEIELRTLIREFDQLSTEFEEIQTDKANNRDAELKLERLTTEHIATAAQLNAVCQEMAGLKARTEAEAKAKEEEYKKAVDSLQFHLSVVTSRAASANKTIGETEEEDDQAVLQARIEERDRRIVELEAAVLRGEEVRRQMHNRIQELRGNIRVFVRTRPFLPGDGAQTNSAIDVSPDEESLTIEDIRTSKAHNFNFDKVFPPSSGQDLVFQEVSDFVQSALDGYHVCLFSYGQTGSGKTHTMQGSGNGAMRGIIPRAVEQILHHARLLQGRKWDFQLSASFLEIYNEELKDLLVRKDTKSRNKLAIKRGKDGKSFVDGLSEMKIETGETETGMQQLEQIMAVAARSRSVASTKMNAQSSRSHSVFMLHLRGFNEETGAEVHGALNLCDLAGSERLDRSQVGSDAKRLRETQSINKSLSCLGDVFNALAQGASHVPYRNSKLTYLLQDCLSGDGKALMFVNLSPTTESSNESLCSLRFAQRVNQVELGKATKHIQYKNR